MVQFFVLFVLRKLITSTLNIEVKEMMGHELYVTLSTGRGLCPDFVFGLLNQPIMSEILTQPSPYKRSESNSLVDEKDFQHLGQSGLCICTYTSLTKGA